MKIESIKRVLATLLCTTLIAATAVSFTGCGNNKEKPGTNAAQAEKIMIGEGETTFVFSVVDENGTETFFDVATNQKTVGDALQELKLIDGEESQYGLYVKSVNGVTFDYDKDKKYWAFYVNGEYATQGADKTEIVPGDTYSFRVEK